MNSDPGAESASHEPLFRLIADQVHDIILETDLNGVIRYLSPSAQIFTDDPAALIGHSIDDLQAYMHPDDRDGTTAVVTEAIANLEPVRYEYRHRVHSSEKDYVWLDVSLNFLTDDGELRGVVTVSRDITHRKRLEAQVLQAQKLDALGVLVGGIVHELNNMLTPIAASVSLALDDVEPDTRLANHLTRIETATARATELTRKILAFSRTQPIETSPADLSSTVRDFASVVTRTAPDDVVIEFDLDDSIPFTLIDPTQVEQVVLNLVMNASDAMPEGGNVKIETAVVELGSDELEGCVIEQSPGTYAMLRVTDDGAGIAPDLQGRMFEPFFTTKPLGQGAGLGLSTTYGIVRDHRGTIQVNSEPGQGSSIAAYFPVSEHGHVQAVRSAPEPMHSGTETIVLLDDEALIVELLADALTAHGYRVVSATNPTDCLARVSAHEGSIDLVVTDVVMPHMSGPAVYDRILDERPNTPVLYMSGYTDNVVLRHGVQAGDTRLLQKPFTLPEFLAQVREALEHA